jgi:hypothetical protein
MYRYPVSRGRWIAALAGVVLLVGCVLPWYTVGGDPGNLPQASGNAFEATGILVFLVALGILALVTLPYAGGDRPVTADRWPPYLILLVVAIVGLAIRLIDLAGDINRIWPPTRSLGLWIVVLGLILLARATFEIFQRPQER